MRQPCAPSPCATGDRAPLRLARALLPILLLLAVATGAVAQGQSSADQTAELPRAELRCAALRHRRAGRGAVTSSWREQAQACRERGPPEWNGWRSERTGLSEQTAAAVAIS